MKTNITKIILFFIFSVLFFSVGLHPAYGTEPPEWNPVSGKLSMELYGDAYVNGEKIESSGYVLAAFGSGGDADCRGVTDIVRFAGEWQYSFTIVSDHEGEKITFKIWDGNTGKIYDVTDTISFEADALLEKNMDIPLTLGSVTPVTGEMGRDVQATLIGTGFEENTKIIMYPDIMNTKAITGSADTPGIANGVAVSGGFAYVTVGHEGLQIINISDPVSPFIAGSADTLVYAYKVAVSGGFAYMTWQDWDNKGGLQIIDIIGNKKMPFGQ